MSTKKCVMHNALSFIVFIFLDFLEAILCIFFRCIDKFLEGKSSQCYCGNKRSKLTDDCEVSESLNGRRNIFSQMGFYLFPGRWDDPYSVGIDGQVSNRWSDCNCESCLSWIQDGGERLHVVVREPLGGSGKKAAENVIFLHGFLGSSSFWTESVFQNLSETTKQNFRLFAVDLLGFGRSPKPINCQYSLRDHLEMIEKSVINANELASFHLVAHSMGCVIAIALAAEHSKFIKSVTLVAPPCFTSTSKDGGSLEVLERIAEKKLWPLEAFHTSLMSWYEHLGRCLCFLICRHHTTWERLLKLLMRKRDLGFKIKDATKHTHQSAWQSMHNVLCGGAKYMDAYLEILKKSLSVKIRIIHGDEDKTVPVECSYNIKRKVPHAELSIIPFATHSSMVFDKDQDFTQTLEQFWTSTYQI